MYFLRIYFDGWTLQWFHKNIRHKGNIKDGLSQRETKFFSLQQFACQYNTKFLLLNLVMETTTLMHMAQRKGVSLPSCCSTNFHPLGGPGDGRWTVSKLFAQVFLEATSPCNCLDLHSCWHEVSLSQPQVSLEKVLCVIYMTIPIPWLCRTEAKEKKFVPRLVVRY